MNTEKQNIVYGKSTCGPCRAAKMLLDNRGIQYDWVEVNFDSAELSEKVGKPVTTVPQIIIDGQHIGGYTDLRNHFGVF